MPARRILSLWFPRLGADRLLRRAPLPGDAPFAVVRETGQMQVLSSLSESAARAGLRVDQPLRDAHAMCPNLVTRLQNPQAEAAFLAALARWAGRFSPWVAVEPVDALMLDITGCAHLFGGEEAMMHAVVAEAHDLGLVACPGLADTPGAAWALARFAGQEAGHARSGDAIDMEARATRSRAVKRRHWERGGAAPAVRTGASAPRIAPPGLGPQVLADLPVAALRITPGMVADLARVGLRRVGELMEQPRAPLARRFGRRGRVRTFDERMQHLRAIADDYGAMDFRLGRAIDPAVKRVGSLKGGRLLDLTWDSDYEPWGADVAEKYLGVVENRTAAARLYAHNDPRPVVILVHGYMAGHWNSEHRLWPVERLYQRGFDVAMFVQPFHAVRADPTRKRRPRFPSGDPRMTNEGFRQSVGDLSDLVAWLRGTGHAAVGLMGMSLGGHTSALAATLFELDFMVPVIPLASLADYAHDRRILGRGEQAAVLREAVRRAHFAVNPLDKRPLIAPERTLVVGAEGDRVTPIHHAQKLSAHFGAPLLTWPGGHLLQIGRKAAYDDVIDYLAALAG